MTYGALCVGQMGGLPEHDRNALSETAQLWQYWQSYRKGYGRIMGIEESRYKDFFVEIQEEAKKAKRGIWSGGK